MTTTSNRSLLVLVACFVALALQPLHAAPPHSAKAFFVGDSIPDTPASDALNPESWSGGVLPKETDDVVVMDSFRLVGPAGVFRVKSFVISTFAPVYFDKASLNVSGDVTLDSYLVFRTSQSSLTVGGTLVVHNGRLRLLYGLAEGMKGEPAPRYSGNSLKVDPGQGIELAWYAGVPQGMPGNTVPFIRLSGDATFALNSAFFIDLEKNRPEPGLLPGEYLLLTAVGTIKGPLPELSIQNEPFGAKTKSKLQLSPDKRKLLLVVTALK